jgi:hypothetical protein
MGIVRQNGTVSLTPNTQKQYIKQLRLPFKNLLVNPTAEIIEDVIKKLGVSGSISWLTDHNRGDPAFDGKVSINIVVSGDPVNLIINDKSTIYECAVIDEAASQVYMSDGKERNIFKLSIKSKTFDEVISILTPYLYK